jgi:hypothetical protein
MPFAPRQPIEPSGNVGFDYVGLDIAGKEEVHGDSKFLMIDSGSRVIGFHT